MTGTIRINGDENPGTSIDKNEVRKAISTSSLENLNRLAIGAIEVDKYGKILEYSEAGNQFSGFNNDEVIGRNFFKDIATCTDYGEFKKYFYEIVEGKREEALFDFLLTNFRPPVKVQVMLKRSIIDQKYWIFIKKLL